jgi:hypothetical protein
MEKERIQELITRYNAGLTTSQEEREIEQLIEQGSIDMEDLGALNMLHDSVVMMNTPEPSANLDHSFYQRLSLEKKSRRPFSWSAFFSWPEFAPKLAMACVTLIMGVGVGYYLKPNTATTTASNQEIADLGKQVSDLKEMMMLDLLEKESASERLRAVSLTQDMDQASQKVTSALLETLNKDSNVNVRLAALDALRPYVNNSGVREALVRAIGKQESPLVQVALAELMAALQVKSSVNELKKIIEDENMPKDVKNKIKESIDVLI